MDADRRAAADQDFATAAGWSSGDPADEAVELADRAITTYLEELGDVASAAAGAAGSSGGSRTPAVAPTSRPRS